MDSGALVPDEVVIGLVDERLVAAGRRARASCSTASRARWPRPRRSTRMLRRRGQALDRVVFFDVSP